ncbi:MAG: hypothetical protein ACU0BK_14775 [Shimia sp.]
MLEVGKRADLVILEPETGHVSATLAGAASVLWLAKLPSGS